jgi:hypothetical protein
MLIKNLLDTWVILAPNEWSYVKTWIYFLIPSNIKYSILEKHVQKQIEARGWVWEASGYISRGKNEYKVQLFDEYFQEFHIHGKWSDKLHVAFLYAYLIVLTDERSVVSGQWRHFKGDVIEVTKENTYFYNGKKYGIEPNVFLEIVGGEEPLHEGLLRFVQLSSD